VKLLLDTHTLIWTMNDSPRLSQTARSAVKNRNNEVVVSVVSVWEAATKYRQGKLPEAARLLSDPPEVLDRMRFTHLPLQLDHAKLGGSLVSRHKDPFDRMLAAQALLEGLTLVSADTIFDSMLVTRLW
jgi:PIN domain nuclease of toxin-antitoxin system